MLHKYIYRSTTLHIILTRH